MIRKNRDSSIVKRDDDKFAVLETYKNVHRAPYNWHLDEAADVIGYAEECRRGAAVVAFGCSEDDARHIATWSPDVTSEVVENMRKTMELAEHVAATDPGEEISTRSLAMLAEELMDGIDALLAKVKEQQG